MANPLYDNHGGIQTHAIILDFPRCDGEDPQGWVYWANQFFAYHQANLHHRVLLASMEGKTFTWFPNMEASGGISSGEGSVVGSRAYRSIMGIYKTTITTLTGETTFTLAFGSEEVTPVEIGMPTHRV